GSSSLPRGRDSPGRRVGKAPLPQQIGHSRPRSRRYAGRPATSFAPGQFRPERVTILAMVMEPAASSPTAANRRSGAGGSGRRRQPPRAGARPSETDAYVRLPFVAGLARR
ncbi:MAG: hypothetical protein ACRDPL_06140, partial [Propionibacteriaceae bacterium]